MRSARVAAEPDTLEREIEQFHPSSFGWALVCCAHDREEASEVLQIAYVKALDGRATFDDHSTVRTWFFGVVRHTASERRRARWTARAALERLARATRPAEPTPEALSAAAEQRGRLRRLLQLLSSRQREILHLVFYQDLTVEQAADVLGVSLGAARRHYERGKARLRRELGERGECR